MENTNVFDDFSKMCGALNTINNGFKSVCNGVKSLYESTETQTPDTQKKKNNIPRYSMGAIGGVALARAFSPKDPKGLATIGGCLVGLVITYFKILYENHQDKKM
ncbi:hypothetical protein DWQ65_00740 [Treponema phagedenis]|uniref:Uncharacterized protein n=1 Tax=Treponema phagedenis TaxID=162 RepID=A0A0B7GQM8_TREPH|nr:hypothetical protein [Treponema phagedenis]EFW36531.1 hypothetical protein HMPREF9554_02995 [Treponema phagedenis F0421]NVP24814.1 hypothetical protein [Treponema phagedenis]QEJ94363.1 hypothetical protein FUT79_03490 [Treponema phagedenis]QEJ98927.1 hypothetical protein FUT82_13590 [Treponema phagedenis]QEK01719.1 hypothetical protein FUT84_11505 [Treponema phagedenis]